MDTHRTEFTLIGQDPGSGAGGRRTRRLLCLTEDGATLAIWGRHGNTAHIEAIEAAGFPCTISCDWREPTAWETEKYGHTHSLDENAYLKVL